MRMVLNCNALISAVRTNGTCREVIDRAVRRHEIVLFDPILSEYKRLLGGGVSAVNMGVFHL